MLFYRARFRAALVAAALALPVAGLATAPAQAAKDAVYTSTFSDVGAGGYDVVAFIEQNAQIEGDRAHQAEWNGATWRFASAESRAKFEADPAAYAPQYGGYCAWAAAEGYTAPGDPDNWSVVDGKLYLNYNDAVQARWEADIPGFIAQADANWPTILD